MTLEQEGESLESLIQERLEAFPGVPGRTPTQVLYLEVDCSLNPSMYTATYGAIEFLLINVFISTLPIKEPLWDMSIRECLDSVDPTDVKSI